jgi:hypothetical protein
VVSGENLQGSAVILGNHWDETILVRGLFLAINVDFRASALIKQAQAAGCEHQKGEHQSSR